MKIITEDTRYRATCPNCGCAFECKELFDIERIVVNGVFMKYAPKVRCPECEDVARATRVEGLRRVKHDRMDDNTP